LSVCASYEETQLFSWEISCDLLSRVPKALEDCPGEVAVHEEGRAEPNEVPVPGIPSGHAHSDPSWCHFYSAALPPVHPKKCSRKTNHGIE